MADVKIREGLIHSFDRSRIFFKHWDRGADLTLVLCDGLGCTGYIWTYIIPHFSKQYNVVHFNYRAHGRSGPPATHDNCNLQAMARDLLAVIDHIQPGPTVLVGHSVGTQVMYNAADLAANDLLGLISICGTFGQPLAHKWGPQKSQDMLDKILELTHQRPRWFQYLWERSFHSKIAFQVATLIQIDGNLVKEADFQPYLKDLGNINPFHFFAMLESIENTSAEPFLRTTESPCLVIAGEKDTFTPKMVAQKMYRLLQNAELHVERGLSHVAPLELPELIHLRMENFINKNILPRL